MTEDDKILKLWRYVDGVNDTPFIGVLVNDDGEEVDYGQVEIGSFDYGAQRMGGAPTISADINYELCLDKYWSKDVYVKFKGERYFLRQIPTSSLNNTSLMYEHNVTFVSERIALDNVYFYDAVSGQPQAGDKPVSNSAEVMFFGDIHEFVGRLNASLEYAGLLSWYDDGTPNGYYASVDDGITTEAKQMSFSNQFFSNVLQEIYNTYELPYYFKCYTDDSGRERKEIHIGFTDNAISQVFRYGVDDALLSITKNNANTKVVNKVTGVGGEENIPYYYPNKTPKACGVSVTKGSFSVEIVDGEALESKTKIGDVLTYYGNYGDNSLSWGKSVDSASGKFATKGNVDVAFLPASENLPYGAGTRKLHFEFKDNKFYDENKNEVNAPSDAYFRINLLHAGSLHQSYDGEGDSFDVELNIPSDSYGWSYSVECVKTASSNVKFVSSNISSSAIVGWVVNNDESETYSAQQLGLAIAGMVFYGDSITIRQDNYIAPQKNLMPPIYRSSLGKERFYEALNGEEGYEGYEFPNPYEEGKPVEQIVEFPDIKPTIKGMKNASGTPIDEFLEFAFDLYDNNEVDENGDYIHSHFFAKLPAMPFNLFDHAIENGEMTVNMTGGSLGGCSFVVAVSDADENGIQWNTVQVDNNGDLIRDEDGNVLCGVGSQGDVEPQEVQNDTRNAGVWIALKKDKDYTTYARPTLDAEAEAGAAIVDTGGTPIEGKQGHYLPYEGSTFVFTNILLPHEYITSAEERLKTALLDYMRDNNVEKFNFSIAFSRIFLAEQDEDFLNSLNENARIQVEYDGETYLLYVSSYTYKMLAGELLPEILVELSEDLTVSQNAIQTAISEVKGDLLNTIGNMDVLGIGSMHFLRKDQKDKATKLITFDEGIEVGKYSEGTLGSGARIGVDNDGGTYIEADYLKIRKKATFTTITTQEMKSVGGEIVISPAAMVCSSVEEVTSEYKTTDEETGEDVVTYVDAYRCYFNTADNDGRHIFNEFEVDDQARCQVFNVLGTRYYWRLVVGVGDNYIDLSKEDCDEGSDVPQAGDAIVTMGNRKNADRQNAIVHSAYGEYAPSMTQYAGINSYGLEGKMVTRFSPKGNLITGQLRIEAGTTGVENLNINVGASNLLRNSGFTGDYLSEPLADEDVMYGDKTLFSDPLDHWTTNNIYPEEGTETIYVYVQDSVESASKKEVVFVNGGVLSQELYYPTISGESYVLSFKAKGYLVQAETEESEAVYNTMGITIGSTTYTMMLSDVYERHSLKLVSDGGGTITFSCDSVTMCELQLERGNLASAWGNSFMDNSSDRTYWQSMKYLQDAIAEGSTIVNGGLVLTNHIKVGNYVGKEMVKETGGMNGTWTSDDSVAFWAGGNLQQGLNAILETGEDEANFAVSHGGKVVMNDAKVRGEIHATKGTIGDKTTIEDGIIKTSAIELSDYVVYRHKSVQDVCNNGEVSSSYTLPSNAPSYLFFSPLAHSGYTEGVDLNIPEQYEEGRLISIVSSPRIARQNPNITLRGSFYLSILDEEEETSKVSTSITLKGGKIELYYDGSYWIVLSPMGTNILNND